ncbi:hypothetical protein [Actinocorallia herbida]|uniref:hypothetical protein n=1 Tax=Actinocorallia herbida TaxID=58109 RepID=UPI000F4CCDC3|nr:hypothetical protein [Actinocorallia herbida]
MVGGDVVAESAYASGERPVVAAGTTAEGAGYPDSGYPESGDRGEDFGGLDDGPGVAGYAGVDMSGPEGPVKAGIPSSGNWRMPEWMREETEANKQAGVQNAGFDEGEMRRDRGRTYVFAGMGAVALVAFIALGVMVLKEDGSADDGGDARVGPSATTKAPVPTLTQDPEAHPLKPLKAFKGAGSPVAGAVADANAGLTYPAFGGKWTVPTKKNKLFQPGWSGQQIMVTEQKGTQLWYGTILSKPLGPVEKRLTASGSSLQEKTELVASGLEDQLYRFPHKNKPIASQELKLEGGKGWLVASQFSFDRTPIRAKSEIVVTALVDTGKKSPSLLFMSMPNTAKNLWPDINAVVDGLRVG